MLRATNVPLKRNSKQAKKTYIEIFYGFMSMNLENCQVNSFLLATVHKPTNNIHLQSRLVWGTNGKLRNEKIKKETAVVKNNYKRKT